MRNDKVIEAGRWLKEAFKDLKSAEIIYKEGIYSICCFHCEQAVQKVLKAFLYFKGERFIAIHSCVTLNEKCTEYDSNFSKFKEYVRKLDQYYIPTRYPDAIPFPQIPSEIYTKEQAEDAINITKEIYEFIKSKIEFSS